MSVAPTYDQVPFQPGPFIWRPESARLEYESLIAQINEVWASERLALEGAACNSPEDFEALRKRARETSQPLIDRAVDLMARHACPTFIVPRFRVVR